MFLNSFAISRTTTNNPNKVPVIMEVLQTFFVRWVSRSPGSRLSNLGRTRDCKNPDARPLPALDRHFRYQLPYTQTGAPGKDVSVLLAKVTRLFESFCTYV